MDKGSWGATKTRALLKRLSTIDMALMDDIFCLVQFCLGHSLKRKKTFSDYIEVYELKMITLFIEVLTLVFSFISVLSHTVLSNSLKSHVL